MSSLTFSPSPQFQAKRPLSAPKFSGSADIPAHTTTFSVHKEQVSGPAILMKESVTHKAATATERAKHAVASTGKQVASVFGGETKKFVGYAAAAASPFVLNYLTKGRLFNALYFENANKQHITKMAEKLGEMDSQLNNWQKALGLATLVGGAGEAGKTVVGWTKTHTETLGKKLYTAITGHPW